MHETLLVNPAEALALQRFGLLTKIREARDQGMPLAQALQRAAAVPIQRADGSTRTFSVRTLEDWWYAYQQGGFAKLHPQPRSDRDQFRSFTAAQQQHILEQARAFPLVRLQVLYRQWKEKDPTLPSLSSVYRLLRRHQLDAKRRQTLGRQNFTGPTKAFETPVANELWMADFSPGPYLHPAGQAKALSTQLCLLVDDHSRLVPYGAYYLQADNQAFHQSLKEAVRRRGLPVKLYTDQGAVFTNDHTRIICANLGIRLLHAKPYHAWSKGKVERLFRTIQEDFQARLRLPGQGVHSLEELNAQFSRWLQEVYHPRVHSATGVSPEARFAQHAHQLRLVDPHQDLDRLFYLKVERAVRKDGTVRLDNELYEVDLSLRCLKIQLRYDPYRRDRIEVYFRGQSFGLARKADLHFNSQNDPRDQYHEKH